jgi:thiol-disulfide isomerase/thioredoxin
MHRQNIMATGMLILISIAVVATGYAKKWGPLMVLNAGVSRLTKGADQGIVGTDNLVNDTKAPIAPELSNGTWLNSDPLTLKSLRGRVVIVNFWTFGCYNCRNTLPSIRNWDARYRNKGLTIIGVHTPEFEREKNIDNLRREIAELGIRYPVVTDNDNAMWNAYKVQAWPTWFVIDRQGRLRWKHVGEGAYDETEQVIKKLLAENYIEPERTEGEIQR